MLSHLSVNDVLDGSPSAAELFPLAAAQIWNSLYTVTAHRLDSKAAVSKWRHLKTFLQQQSFCL